MVIEFLEDFAGKKKGFKGDYPPYISKNLIDRKIAREVKERKKKVNEPD